MRTRTVVAALGTTAAFSLFGLAVPATAADGYDVTVTCSVPNRQPERQLAPNHCLNYIPDGTQTYTAHVLDGNGAPAAGVTVTWTDSDPKSAKFRLRQNPCTTNDNGVCSAELIDRRPRPGKVVTVMATAGDATGVGYLTFK